MFATASLALAGLALELFAFWPGLMSVDSVMQYTQAALRRYNDLHPPIMAWLWSWTDRVVAGPAGMLIFHLTLQWTGLWAIAEGARRRGLPHPWLVPIVGFLPFVANIAGVIWKDVGMAYALLCSGGLVYASHGSRRTVRFAACAVAIVLIGYATMVRHNAVAASFALACYVAWTIFPRIGFARSVVGGAAFVVILLSAQQVIERKVLEASHFHLAQVVMLFDLVGIACGGGADIEIALPFRAGPYDTGALCSAYDPDQVDTLFFFPNSPLRMSLDEDALTALKRSWLAAIAVHPNLYVIHRVRAFAGLVGLRRVPQDYVYLRQPFMQTNPWGFVFVANALSRALDASVDTLAGSGVFSGALWLVLALGLLGAIGRRRMQAPFETALLTSGLMYAFAYVFFSVAPNYRYLYWTVLATAVAAMLVLLRAVRQVRDSDGDHRSRVTSAADAG